MATPKGHFLEGKRIIVAGAGMAGLSFAIALRKLWDPALKVPQVLIYDRDAKHVGQDRLGYSLSISGLDENGGMFAFKELGLLDQILQHALITGDRTGGFQLWDTNWGQLVKLNMKPHADLPTSAIRIARSHIRETLIGAAEEKNIINWSTMCTSAERLPNGRIRVHISPSGGSGQPRTEDCDVLVAADGASSKIRASFRPDDNRNYAGAVQMGGVGRFSDGIPPPVDSSWGMIVSGAGIGCFLSPVDETGVVWGLSRLEQLRASKYNPDSLQEFEAMKAEALELGHMLREPFQTIVHHTEQKSSFIMPARDKQPFAHSDENLKNVIFIGDSNHAVSPFAGHGANLALKDGWDLANRLCVNDSLEEAVTEYDRLALPRAVKTLDMSHRTINLSHWTGLKFQAFRAAMYLGGWLFMWLSGR